MLQTIQQPEPLNAREVISIFHTMAKETSMDHAYHAFQSQTVRESLNIPNPIWKRLDPILKKKIEEIRNQVRSEKTPRPHHATPEAPIIPDQYPTMVEKESPNVMNLCELVNSQLDLTESETDDEDIVDEIFHQCHTTVRPDPE